MHNDRAYGGRIWNFKDENSGRALPRYMAVVAVSRVFFFFSVESAVPIKIKTAGCCRSIGSMPVARISKWIVEDSTAHLAGRR